MSAAKPARSDSISAESPKPFSVILAPAEANALARPSPIPLVEPVITATRPCNDGTTMEDEEGAGLDMKEVPFEIESVGPRTVTGFVDRIAQLL
ncbi:MAG: hypothetical protein WCF85_15735 [Rhodospirillaceae bacterium]